MKKRTYQTFLGSVEDELGTSNDSILKDKFELKYAASYKDIGVLPGVKVDETKRRKILEELGVQKRVPGAATGAKKEVEEEKIAVPPTSE